MQVSIVMSTRDRGTIFNEALYSVEQAVEGLDAEVIVINDSKISRPIIPSNFLNIRLIDNPKNGVASARNLGASLSNGEFILFMDDDFVIPPNSIALALEIGARDSKKIHLFNWVYPPSLLHYLNKFQFGRYLIAYKFTSVEGWLGNEWRDEDLFELNDGASYFLLIKRSVFEEIGGYNETFLHAGAEDYDFVQRAKGNGVRFYLDKSCTLYHNERDRIDLKNWLKRKERNGKTIKRAFQVGHKKMEIQYSSLKQWTLITLFRVRFLFFALMKLIPNVSIFDSIYFKLTNLLLAIYIFRGYTED